METEIKQTKSEKIDELVKALVKVQASLEPSKADAVNPYLEKNYSNLRACWDAAGPLLAANGLAVIQTFGGTADNPSVITLLAHISGQWVEGTMIMNPGKKDCQGQGAAGTYGRRYGFCAAVGLYQEDLDGEDTGKADKNKNKYKGKQPTPTPKPKPKPKPTPLPPKNNGVVSAAQVTRFHAIKKEYGWSDTAAKSLLAKHGFESTKDIPAWGKYGEIIAELEKGMDGKGKPQPAENATE